MRDRNPKRGIVARGLVCLVLGLIAAAVFWGCNGQNPGPQPPITPPPQVDPEPEPMPTPGPPYIGASVYQAVGFDAASVVAFIKNLAVAGGNATEFFYIFSWDYFQPSGGCWWSPCLQVGTYEDPGNAEAAGFKFPLFDLTQKNPATWAKWKAILAACKKYGVTPFFRLEDFCSIKTAVSKRAYLFRGNTDRINADGSDAPNRRWYNWEGGYEVRRKEIIRWLLDEIHEAGIEDYYLVPMNEADLLDSTEADVLEWHRKFIRDLDDLGVPGERIILNVGRAYEAIKAAFPSCRWEHHGCASPQRMDELRSRFGAAINFNGDGPDPNASGSGDGRPNHNQPSTDQGRKMGEKAKTWGAFAVLFYARMTEAMAPADIRNVGEETWTVIRALSAAAFAK